MGMVKTREKLTGKSFSDRLSWRIIGIVVVVSLFSQTVAAIVIADGSFSPMDWWRESSMLLIYLNIIGLVSLVVLYFLCRGVVRRSVFYGEELEKTTAAKKRMESDLTMAHNIQQGMLRTGFPPNLYAFLQPAKEVGGDLYDFDMKDDQLYFAIADVSGKGVAASLLMAITRVMVRFVVGMGLPMDETVRRINDSFSNSNEASMFVTMFVARIDLKTGHMDYCNAGHCPLLVMPPNAEPYLLKCKPNLALGLFEKFNYEAEQIDFEPGTRLMAYTDGVTEAERKDMSQYGNERLLAWAKHVHESDEEKTVVESLYQSVCEFMEGNPQNDDITIMSVKIPNGV